MHTITGTVTGGKKRGRAIGFPTANIMIEGGIPDGVYASEIDVHGQTYQAAAFVGASETYGETDKKLEVYILDFDGDIYGQDVTVRLYKSVRDPSTFKFESVALLIEQIRRDISAVRAYFQNRDH